MSFPPPTEKQARLLWFSLTAFAVGVLLGLIGMLFWGLSIVLQVLSPVLLPLALAGVLAYLLDPIVDFLEEKKIPRTRAILLVFFMAVMFILILLATVVPRVIYETGALIEKAPAYSRQLKERIESSPWGKRINESLHLPAETKTNAAPAILTANTMPLTNQVVVPTPVASAENSTLSEKILSWTGTVLPEIGAWVLIQLKRVGSWIGLLIGFFLVPIYAFYFLKEKMGIQKNWSNYLPMRESSLKDEVIFILSSINDCLIVFFRGQVLVALCSGALLTTAFLVMGLNYGVLLGVMAGVLGIIPYLGVLMSLVPAVALAAIQFGDWWHPLLVVGIFGLVNLMEGLVISPKIIGDRVGLHPLTIIIAVMIGTTLLGGIVGGVLAIPLTAALRALMFRYVWKKAPSKKR